MGRDIQITQAPSQHIYKWPFKAEVVGELITKQESLMFHYKTDLNDILKMKEGASSKENGCLL